MTTLSLLPPIPPLSEPQNWARLPIRESGEPLVAVTSLPGRLVVRSLYAEQGIPGAPIGVSVRAGVHERLQVAAHSLPVEVELVVFDGYRPLTVQQYLWDSFYAEIAAQHPEDTETQWRERTMQFVATPTADPNAPPPHRSGGAVDVYLRDTRTGEPLPMGTEPDETSPASATRWYEEHPEEPFTTYRRLLYHAMTGAGFTNYLGEWWHYDWGNQRWANCSGAAQAIYGLAE
ncbi:MAG: M15 family metallopeptidase [Armatimonadaceae bacterium]